MQSELLDVDFLTRIYDSCSLGKDVTQKIQTVVDKKVKVRA